MFLVLFFFFHSASIYEKLLWIRHSFKEFEIQQWTKEKKQSLHFQLSLIKRISWKFCCSTELRTQTQDSDPVNLRKGLEIYQFSSVAQSCLTLCNPMDCSMPGLPVHHQLLEFTQTRVHWVSDAIQPSHPLSSPSPPTFNLSKHQRLKWVSSSHQVAKVLEFQLQHQSFQWIVRVDFL